MEEEKIQKNKPHTTFNRRLSFVKKLEGNMKTAKKKFKILFYKGEYGKGYYDN